jgi:PhnB protein
MKTDTTSTIQPYLNFNGRCDEAIEFYKTAAGAEVTMLMRFKDNPEPPPADADCQPGAADKVMHAEIRIGASVIMLSDGRCTGTPAFEGISLAMRVATPADAERLYNGLAAGGEPMMPLAKTFFSPSFGMLQDKFGVGWMVMAAPQG